MLDYLRPTELNDTETFYNRLQIVGLLMRNQPNLLMNKSAEGYTSLGGCWSGLNALMDVYSH